MDRIVQKIITIVIILSSLPLLLASPKVIDSKKKEIIINDIAIPVLNYHKVDEQKIALSISPQEFEEQIKYLAKEGYNTITPSEMMNALEYGTPLPEKPIMITFDDGYLDNYTNAYPILKKYGFTATIFLVTGFIGNDPRFMNWEEIKEMKANGFVFGSHTVNHKSLTELSYVELKNELLLSAEEIEQQLGHQELFFAYPTGTYTLNIAKIVESCGYRAAFTIKYGDIDEASNYFALERIPIFKGQKTFRSFFFRLNFTKTLQRLGLIRT